MDEFAWKLFALTGNIDIYLLFKEIKRVESVVNVGYCHDCESSQPYIDKHLYRSNLKQVEKNPF